jgi:PAS domain S-box-containing protein
MTTVADKPRRIREARHARENELRNLLATSSDAVVVTDDQHRFVAANTPALELFGVSEANIKNFTLDSFISKGQTPGFNGHGASFSSSEVKKGNCQIRRLNGNLRLADYELTANHLPFRHLCIFRNVSCKTIRPIAKIAASPAVQSR